MLYYAIKNILFPINTVIQPKQSFKQCRGGRNPKEYTVLNSIPGIGKVYSAGILAEIGSVKAFQNTNALVKYCGIFWTDNNSVDFEAEYKRMSKVCNSYLRYCIIEATESVIRHCLEYERFYQKKPKKETKCIFFYLFPVFLQAYQNMQIHLYHRSVVHLFLQNANIFSIIYCSKY